MAVEDDIVCAILDDIDKVQVWRVTIQFVVADDFDESLARIVLIRLFIVELRWGRLMEWI